MQRADLVIGVLAVVALAGSAIGVVMYEPAAAPRWDITVATQERTNIEVLADDLQAGGTAEATWTVTEQNVTMVDFSVSVTSATQARTQALVVRVTVTAPNVNFTEIENVTLPSPSGASAQGEFSVEVGETPAGGEDEAADREAAIATIPVLLNGTGDWIISAQIVSGGAGIPPVVPPETVSVTVTVDRYTFYTVDAAAPTPDLGEAA